jgi:hypothetical protein
LTAPPTSSAAAVNPASLVLARPGSGGAGANWLSGHDMTTRSPPIRGQRLNAAPFCHSRGHRSPRYDPIGTSLPPPLTAGTEYG